MQRRLFSHQVSRLKTVATSLFRTSPIYRTQSFHVTHEPFEKKEGHGKKKISTRRKRHPTMSSTDPKSKGEAEDGMSPETRDSFVSQFNKIMEYNKEANLDAAVEAYEELKRKHIYEMSVEHYTKIIESFAPRKLMFKYFIPYKDFVDMYYEVGFVQPYQRMEEAHIVFEDILRSPLELKPNLATYHAYMKTQLSCGSGNIYKVFNTFNHLNGQHNINPNLTTFTILLRACSLLERDDIAEELFAFTLMKIAAEKRKNFLIPGNDSQQAATASSTTTTAHLNQLNPARDVPIHFYNTMLDVYSETRNNFAFWFADKLLEKRMPVNGTTFNVLAKACIFTDQREKLVPLVEKMRVHGVLQRELSEPVRREIYDAYQQYSLKHFNNSRNYKFFTDYASTHGNPFHQFDPAKTLRQYDSWGREIDERDFEFLRLIKPELDKYELNLEKLLTPKSTNYVPQTGRKKDPHADLSSFHSSLPRSN